MNARPRMCANRVRFACDTQRVACASEFAERARVLCMHASLASGVCVCDARDGVRRVAARTHASQLVRDAREANIVHVCIRRHACRLAYKQTLLSIICSVECCCERLFLASFVRTRTYSFAMRVWLSIYKLSGCSCCVVVVGVVAVIVVVMVVVVHWCYSLKALCEFSIYIYTSV